MEAGSKSKQVRSFKTNQEIAEAWYEDSKIKLRPVTLKHYNYEVRRFCESWGDTLVTELTKMDFWDYMDQYGKLCRSLTRKAKPFTGDVESVDGLWCLKKLDMADCGSACGKYDPLAVDSVGKHLTAVISLFDFMAKVDLISVNFTRDAVRSWKKENKHRKRVRPKRVLTKMEVELLINKCPYMHRRVFYLLMAKTGVRVSEAISLRMTPELYQPRKGWIKIPEFPGKRRGNRVLIVDEQLLRYLTAYEIWRERKLRRLGKITDSLFISHRGEPYVDGDTVNRGIEADALRNKIVEPNAPGQNRLTSHAFRHFFSDFIEKANIATNWWDVLRGDTPKGNRGTYVHLKPDNIRSVYLEYAPVLDIQEP